MNETAAGGSSNTSSVMAAMPSPSNVADTSKGDFLLRPYEPKRVYRSCIVSHCTGKRDEDEVLRLFTFPKPIDMRKKWAENLRMQPEDIQTYSRICERHFETRCVGSQRLVENAIPTLELGYEPPHAIGLLTGKGWRKCCIQNCKSNENEVYHRFPKEGPMRWAWLKACGLPQDSKDRYICGLHFLPDVGNKKRLPASTVPSENLIIAEDMEDGDQVSYVWGGSRRFDDEPYEWDTNPNDPTNYEHKAITYDFDPSISEEERRFYLKAYATVEAVRERKVHCTVCKTHIGTAAAFESSIKMHPILRVTHCMKCHDFYNSGEFSKGEDGSELYCRWCGQGGEVYCCSSCPYVFCKSCIVKNLSKGVVADIEQNENWNCFSCAPKILWPLRAQHWALMNYIEVQKKEISSMNLPEHEYKIRMSQDRSKCCRLAKSKCGNMSDSMESLDSVTSKRSHGSSGSAKKPLKHPSTPSPQLPSAKRAKTNDEVVCTPDLLSMLEPDCQITVTPKNNTNQQRPMQSMPSTSTPRIMSIPPPSYGNMSTPKSSAPPPLVLRNTAIKLRPIAPAPIVRRTVIGPRAPMPGGNGTPVYHTINGYRIDLNSAAQQETFRLPNGKLIQVKRQGPPPGSGPQHNSPSTNSWQIQTQPSQQQQQQQQQRVVPQTIASRPVQITQHQYPIPNMSQSSPQPPPGVRYHGNVIGSTTINAIGHNGSPLQVINGQISSPQTANIQQQQSQMQTQMTPGAPIRPVMVRHIFPDNPIGSARTQLQEQVFNAMEICTHLTNKVQTLTNSNAYKQARNYLEVKELYIHLSYLLTYAIGRFKGLQDKCLTDMRKLGFGNDADSLENGQLAAAIDYVCYGQLEDVDLFNTGSNSFHNQVYEYRKSLHANLKDGEDGAKSPLPPLFPLGQGKCNNEVQDEDEDSLLEAPQRDFKGHWLQGGGEDSNLGFGQENDENEEPDDNDDDDYSRGGGYGSFSMGTEESMRRNEESHSYDRKLTRLISQYPSIWCTRHPDYGNFEVTRKHWRTIEAHFARGENIKLRWKNIRKRFVRIEKRIADGKRFNGHFDKAMAFLANRDLPEDQWVTVDCGEDDGDTFDRQNLDAIEKSLHRQGEMEGKLGRDKDPYSFEHSMKPIEIEPLDLKIITFVKTNPVLWRKSMDPEADKIDEQTRQTVWRQLAKSLKTISADYIRDRWQHLYEMYKTFRLKTIKSNDDRSNLELKYSKYLAKLYFLYKIDEQELRNENNGLFEDCFELDDDDEDEAAERDNTAEEPADTDSGAEEQPPIKLQNMADDKEFLHKLVQYVREYPALWNTKHDDYNDIMVRDNYWQDIYKKLSKYKHKQASDDEDNEIEIVEPKTDLITLDSDDDEPPPPPPQQLPPAKKSHSPIKIQKHVTHLQQHQQQQQSMLTKVVAAPLSIQPIARPRQLQPPPPLQQLQQLQQLPPVAAAAVVQNATFDNSLPDYDALIPPAEDNQMDLMSMAQSFLASMLEVDITEGSYGPQYSPTGVEITMPKKQPRKKLTNKPNPTLLKQKARMERERLEEMKRNDLKLKMKCAVELRKAEDEFPFAKKMLKAKLLEKQEQSRKKSDATAEEGEEKSTTVMLDMGKETLEVQLVIVNDSFNSSTEDHGTLAIINTSGEEKSPQKNSISSEEADKNETDKTKKDSEILEKSPEQKKKEEVIERSDDAIKDSSDTVEDTTKCDNKAKELEENTTIAENGKDKEATEKDDRNKVDKENCKDKDKDKDKVEVEYKVKDKVEDADEDNEVIKIVKDCNNKNDMADKTEEGAHEPEDDPMEEVSKEEEKKTAKVVDANESNDDSENSDTKDDGVNKEEITTDDVTPENYNKITNSRPDKEQGKDLEPMQEDAAEDTAEASKENATEDVADDSKENATEDVAEDSKENATEDVAEDSKENATVETAEDSKETATEDVAKNAAKNLTEKQEVAEEQKMEVDNEEETLERSSNANTTTKVDVAIKTHEDVEDAEVYKEIEKVLQRQRRDTVNDDVVKENEETITANELEQKSETKTNSAIETLEEEEENESAAITTASPGDGNDSSSLKTTIDGIEEQTECNKEHCLDREEHSSTAAQKETVEKSITAEEEVLSTSNGNV